jgi:hypothetical protein
MSAFHPLRRSAMRISRWDTSGTRGLLLLQPSIVISTAKVMIASFGASAGSPRGK